MPCASGSETPVIDAVRYDFKVEPVRIRTVTFVADERPVGTEIGPPEKLRDGHPLGVPGKVIGDVAGVEVTQPCSKQASRNVQQLLTVMEVDERGGEIDRYYIDYHTESGNYTLEADYGMIACGTDTTPSECS